jgi:hypothetical protein
VWRETTPIGHLKPTTRRACHVGATPAEAKHALGPPEERGRGGGSGKRENPNMHTTHLISQSIHPPINQPKETNTSATAWAGARGRPRSLRRQARTPRASACGHLHTRALNPPARQPYTIQTRARAQARAAIACARNPPKHVNQSAESINHNQPIKTANQSIKQSTID